MKLVAKITLCVFVASLIANMLDLVSTQRFLVLGYREINPFFSHFNTVGIQPTDVILKVAVCFGVLTTYLSMYYPRKYGLISDREYVTYSAISIFVWMFLTAVVFLVVLKNFAIG